MGLHTKFHIYSYNADWYIGWNSRSNQSIKRLINPVNFRGTCWDKTYYYNLWDSVQRAFIPNFNILAWKLADFFNYLPECVSVCVSECVCEQPNMYSCATWLWAKCAAKNMSMFAIKGISPSSLSSKRLIMKKWKRNWLTVVIHEMFLTERVVIICFLCNEQAGQNCQCFSEGPFG